MTSMTQRQESLIRAKPGHRIHLALNKAKMTSSSRPPHWRTILKDWNKCIVATKQQRGIYKDTLHQPENTNSLKDTGDDTTYMVYEGEPAVKLQMKNVEVGTSTNGNPTKDQVTMGRVHSPGSTNHQSISFIRIQYHEPVIAPLLNSSQVSVKRGSNSRVCLLA